jgi:dTDP-L-rhamnose 4-epimerase
MRVLVTGGAGFIGSHLVDLLLTKRYSVRILDNLEPPVHPERQKPDYIPSDVEFIQGDVCHRSDFEKALKGADFIFHLAAYQGYLSDFSKFARVNGGSTALLLELIVNNKLPVQKVILGSSQAVYGEGKYECPEHGDQYPPPRPLEQLEKGEWEVKCPICRQSMEPKPTDERKTNPHNQYAISKYSQELYALKLGQRYGIPTVVLRYSITQGPRQSFSNAYSGILRIFSVRLLNNLPPVVYEDGKQFRDYVHIEDVTRANLLALENEATDFGVFNVGGGKPLTVNEYAKCFIEAAGKDFEPETPGQFRLGDSRHIFSDISKLNQLGWSPKITVTQIIKDYLNWINSGLSKADYYTTAERAMKREGILRAVR